MTKMKVFGCMIVLIMLGCTLNTTQATYDETENFHVCGKVKCQDCSQGWNQWVEGSKPIVGARVSITCLDENKRLGYYGSDATDNDGEFSLDINKNIHGKKLNPKDCVVRLVSSPDSSCNVATNFGHGKIGVKLRQPSEVYRGKTKYIVGPFYYTTPTCRDESDTQNQGAY